MARDDDERDDAVDFVVSDAEDADDSDGAAGPDSAVPARRGPGRGVVLLAAGTLVAALLVAHVTKADQRSATAAPSTAYTPPTAAPGSVAVEYPAPGAAIDGCTYKLQSATVAALPDPTVHALTGRLPGIRVTSSSTQLGHASDGACVLHRVINASLRGSTVQVEVRPATSGEQTGSFVDYTTVGGDLGAQYVDHGRTVKVSVQAPPDRPVAGTATVDALTALVADPRLVQA